MLAANITAKCERVEELRDRVNHISLVVLGPAYGEIKQKHATLEGKPTEEESMVASGVMTLDVGQMTGLLLVSANRQTEQWTLRGKQIVEGVPTMEKLGLAWHWQRHLPLSHSLLILPFCQRKRVHSVSQILWNQQTWEILSLFYPQPPRYSNMLISHQDLFL